MYIILYNIIIFRVAAVRKHSLFHIFKVNKLTPVSVESHAVFLNEPALLVIKNLKESNMFLLSNKGHSLNQGDSSCNTQGQQI